MPIRSHLNGELFDPETIRVMGLAIALRLVDRDDIANEVVARKIIELAGVRLCRIETVMLCSGE